METVQVDTSEVGKPNNFLGGKLTADQVRDIIERHSMWVIGNNRCFRDGAYEAIADELNATLGRPIFDANLEQALLFMRIWISDDAHLGESELSAAFEKAEGLRKLDAIESAIASTLSGGECELVYGENDDGVDGWYTHCGGWFAATRKDRRLVQPGFCQLCGGKAVER